MSGTSNTLTTKSHRIYPAQFQKLSAIAACCIQDRNKAAELIAEYRQNLATMSEGPETLQALLFLNGLEQYINPNKKAANLYLLPEDDQQIRLFQFMVDHFPVMGQSQEIANHLLAASVQAGLQKSQAQHVAILDIGLGSGRQMANLLERLNKQNTFPKKLTLVGIEPAQESIIEARATLEAKANALGIGIENRIDFKFYRTTLEDFGNDNWQDLAELAAQCDCLVMNASFALHHIQPYSQRVTLLSKLKALNPDLMVVLEPWGDFTSNNLCQRLENAWQHYGDTFKALDKIIKSNQEADKAAVKRVFSGREILDVLANDAPTEGFETDEMWCDKFSQAGFLPYPLKETLQNMLPALPLNFAYAAQDKNRQHYQCIRYNVDEHPIAAIMAFS
ncbi:MAG: GRAS family protein [Vampirovibrionales bacterium]|nr:GRAS family protein [Vampirovibrionales bacterium]